MSFKVKETHANKGDSADLQEAETVRRRMCHHMWSPRNSVWIGTGPLPGQRPGLQQRPRWTGVGCLPLPRHVFQEEVVRGGWGPVGSGCWPSEQRPMCCAWKGGGLAGCFYQGTPNKTAPAPSLGALFALCSVDGRGAVFLLRLKLLHFPLHVLKQMT